MGNTKNYGMLDSQEAYKRGLEKRKMQLQEIDDYMQRNRDARLQVNFCKLQSEDHACVTMSGKTAWPIYQEIRKQLVAQIQDLEKKIQQTNNTKTT